MENEQQHYELTLIIPGNLAEDQHPEILNKIKSLLEKNQAKLTVEEDLGRKKLAYPIKQLRHGFYYCLEFDLESDKTKTIEKELKLTSSILRFLLIKKHQKTAAEIADQEQLKDKRIKKKIADQIKTEEAKETKEKIKKPKISLEDLDKKLDELLEDEMVK
ncbi:30S ribosomal protein S6 [Patescibacteria group bacterium]|nr:30S ribosomal protein S6 [Patescibacteria group bacterium]